MIGCDDIHALEKARPYLDIMGKRVIECGGPGAGSATKLCNNLALAAQMIGVCEAMNLGEGLGVDPVVLADVMNISTAKSWSCEVNNPHPEVAIAKGGTTPASRDYQGTQV
jgi:3-hydroxyisobutyrate dehydrogenase